MARKLALLGAAFAIIALSAPAVADAFSYTMPRGVLVLNGKELKLTSSNTTVETELGTLECVATQLEFEVTKNSSSEAKGVGLGEGVTNECSVEGVVPITITNYELGTIVGSGSEGMGTISLAFEADLPLFGTCSYSGTVPISISGESEIEVAGELEVAPEGCGQAAIIRAKQILETKDDGKLVITDRF